MVVWGLLVIRSYSHSLVGIGDSLIGFGRPNVGVRGIAADYVCEFGLFGLDVQAGEGLRVGEHLEVAGSAFEDSDFEDREAVGGSDFNEVFGEGDV